MSSSADSRTTPRRRIAGERGRSRTSPTSPAPPATQDRQATDAPAGGQAHEPGTARGARERWAALRADRTDRTDRTAETSTRPAPHTAEAAALPAEAAAPTGRRRWVAPVAVLVASLAALGVVLGLTLQDAGAQARADRAAASQARTSVEQLLSYNYKTIDGQAAQVEGLLTGSFKGEFTSAMDKTIKPMAVKNQTVVQAKVSDVGVMSSTPTTVKVLAFVNQARVGADQKQPVVDQNRVIATMTKVGDRWLVSKVDAF